MIEKSRLKELEQSITGKQKEMEEVKAKRAAAAGNPVEMVILDKRMISSKQDFPVDLKEQHLTPEVDYILSRYNL